MTMVLERRNVMDLSYEPNFLSFAPRWPRSRVAIVWHETIACLLSQQAFPWIFQHVHGTLFRRSSLLWQTYL